MIIVVMCSAREQYCSICNPGRFYLNPRLFGQPFFEGANASEILKSNRKYTFDYERLNVLKQEAQNTNSKINKLGSHREIFSFPRYRPLRQND